MGNKDGLVITKKGNRLENLHLLRGGTKVNILHEIICSRGERREGNGEKKQPRALPLKETELPENGVSGGCHSVPAVGTVTVERKRRNRAIFRKRIKPPAEKM